MCLERFPSVPETKDIDNGLFITFPQTRKAVKGVIDNCGIWIQIVSLHQGWGQYFKSLSNLPYPFCIKLTSHYQIQPTPAKDPFIYSCFHVSDRHEYSFKHGQTLLHPNQSSPTNQYILSIYLICMQVLIEVPSEDPGGRQDSSLPLTSEGNCNVKTNAIAWGKGVTLQMFFGKRWSWINNVEIIVGEVV